MRTGEGWRWLSAFLPAGLWSVAIFVGSTDLLSSKHTAHYFQRNSQAESVSLAHWAVRKAGHLAEFGILYTLLFFGFNMIQQRPLSSWKFQPMALVLSLSYAAADEWHQTFVPSRSGQLKDVLIDSLGVLLACALCQTLLLRKRPLFFTRPPTHHSPMPQRS
eukprot:Gregarina_sp_Pseudo_9__1561@NODE_2047_length_1181_cov_22_619089_g1890_i0_p1_GENE_NODE_2047_length_1181_cov_22_619089_g1890_i0NODE_2047_length_1181_cov_22_619089_g1890_i0_p1_ORF_typecomplete_len173_score10_24VanZ/PF04892_12/2_9e17Tmemb_185A/PF10269_9/0_036_NODE_2047_length_1181_cov_22_619089_g1890_i06631148